MRSQKLGVVMAALLVLAACGREFARDAGDGGFYAGKTLELVVPFGPGGGTDTWARVIAPHLQRRLGAGSAVQVVNIAGASGVAGANEFAVRRRHDGLTLLVSSATTVFSYLLGEPMVRYDFRDFSAILASPAGGVVFVSPKLRVSSAAELARTGAPLVFGGISPTGNDLVVLVAFELLGLDVKTIMGYSSRGATRVAFEQGETNIEYQTMPSYLANVKPLEEQGLVVPIFSFGMLDEDGNVIRDPVMAGLPSVREAYVAIFGQEPAGPAWDAYRATLAAGMAVLKVLWIHDDAPPEAIEVLRRAAGELTSDSSFLTAARIEVGDYPFYVGETAEQRFAVATSIPPAALAWLRSFVIERYGVERLRTSS
ncbi:MAG: hypothetical protein HY704_15070 [Gemmatimonadetes bacterium]|nr:hypothetical protein [Gemmatimonadota bacterium]